MELVGQYHRDKVLCLPKRQRKQMDLPTWRDDVTIVNELFGWVIKRGKEIIECRSEDEARYIWSFWSFEWIDFWVPKDDKYLEEILPRLLVITKEHHEHIEEKVNLYSRRKIRDELRRQIYLTVTLRDEDFDYDAIEEEIKNKKKILEEKEIETSEKEPA